ncbi:unnamed protein product [Angiostrongylus costaricensis]|uniref:Tudor domain-containing protein n=1 Tax=Angiostrongylus costaricensis TaxID=334426 RepID=A0A0R3Q1L1_ANGCS|nr:unnamed protein product [Angiostrongylus costaricensis]
MHSKRRKSSVISETVASINFRYLPNGHQYIFELEHLDYTLEWLRDEALKKREMELVNRPPGLITDAHYYYLLKIDSYTYFVVDMEYDLEDVNVFNKPLNLFQSIANSGCSEFVLVRKFKGLVMSLCWLGSRGEFHPRGTMFRQKSTALLTPISRTSNNLSLFDLSNGQVTSSEATCMSFDKPSQLLLSEEDEALVSFQQSSVLALTWLPVLGKKTDPLVNEISLRLIAQAYENRTWKVVLVEFETTEKALQAKEHMVDIIHVLNSPAYQAYQHSNDGSRSPSEAAEAVMMEMADGLLPFSSRHLHKGSAIKRLTRIRRALTTRKLTL